MALKLPPAVAPAPPPPHSSYHGRRIMQMLFRANNTGKNNNNDDSNSSGAGRETDVMMRADGTVLDAAGIDKSELADLRAEDDTGGSIAPHYSSATPHAQLLGGPPSKFHSLKRKLFPSRMRTALPTRIPPLITSPIAISATDATADALLQQQQQQQVATAGGAASSAVAALRRTSNRKLDRDSAPLHTAMWNESNQQQSLDEHVASTRAPELQLSTSHQHSLGEPRDQLGDAPTREKDTATATTSSNDDDLELEIAIEHLDAGAEQDTIDEMNRAIEQLRTWRQEHTRETQDAMQQIEQDNDSDAQLQVATDAAEREAQALEQAYEMKKQQWDSERATQRADTKRLEQTFQMSMPKSTLAHDDVARVEQALLASAEPQDSSSTSVLRLAGTDDSATSRAASRLRDEVFDMGVRELSSTIEASLLLEIEDAESELDMPLFDVEAFAAALDSVLAQFDAEPQADAASSNMDLSASSSTADDDS